MPMKSSTALVPLPSVTLPATTGAKPTALPGIERYTRPALMFRLPAKVAGAVKVKVPAPVLVRSYAPAIAVVSVSVTLAATSSVEAAVRVKPRVAPSENVLVAESAPPLRVTALAVKVAGAKPSCESAPTARVPALIVTAPAKVFPNARDVPIAEPVAAFESVMALPLMAAMVVPAAIFAPVTIWPTDRPDVPERAETVVRPAVVVAVTV